MQIIRAYLRASTKDQNAERAREQLAEFAKSHGSRVTTFYVENASGATVERAELQRLLREAGDGDILLVESVDRLTRLPQESWEALKRQISSAGLQIVALDLPTSHRALKAPGDSDQTEAWLSRAIAQMMLDFMAAFARKDYEQRRERQAQGIARARQNGSYRPRQPNLAQYRKILAIRESQSASIRATAKLADCAPNTVRAAIAWQKAQQQGATEQ